MIPPLVRQILVAGSTNLAGLSAGGVIAYPSALLQQFKSNDSIIQLDLNKGSWIGSVHGIAGIPSILMPLLMQCRGRRVTFILSCIFIITGWILTYIAENITTLIIGECFHGLGTNSLVAVSFLSITEMVQPSLRNLFIILYGTLQAFGISSIGILNQYLHWNTIGLVMCCPILLALSIACTWPESPSWLALKGKYEECQRAFELLRGTGEESRKELNALISSQKAQKERIKVDKSRMQMIREIGTTITSTDFYLPAIHIFVLENVLYWGGGMPVIIYAADMFLQSSGKSNHHVKLFMDIALFTGYCITCVLVLYFSAKKVMLYSMFGSGIFMSLASVVTYLQHVGTLPKDSELAVYCIGGFGLVMSFGSISLGYAIGSELMPVKHRGIGGSLYVIYTCLLHASSLKSYPYLCVYLNIWGVFLIYAVYNFISIVIISMYVPDTRHRTLQEIEEYYVNGYFRKTDKDDAVDVPFIKSEINVRK